jgi:Tfp pilus assembly pilus retraction ATPase PilT
VLQTGKSAGMQTMEDHIKNLVQKNLVTQEEANLYLNEKEKDL